MMRNLPPCPSCQEDELCIYRAGNSFRLWCSECGWRVSGELIIGQDLDAVIAAVVKAETPIDDPPVSAPIATEQP